MQHSSHHQNYELRRSRSELAAAPRGPATPPEFSSQGHEFRGQCTNASADADYTGIKWIPTNMMETTLGRNRDPCRSRGNQARRTSCSDDPRHRSSCPHMPSRLAYTENGHSNDQTSSGSVPRSGVGAQNPHARTTLGGIGVDAHKSRAWGE